MEYNRVNIKQIIFSSSQKLSHIDNPIKESELLLSFFIQKTRIFIHTNPNFEVINELDYFKLVEQRANFKPLEYIVSSACFYGLDFYVNEDVLIPRSDSEILIDKMKFLFPEHCEFNLVDIGCGSGVISIVLARYFKNMNIYAIDISSKAIEVAKFNAKKLSVEDRITFIKSDLLSSYDGKIDIIISNPPYIKNNEKIDSNVVDYEPHLALFGGVDGDEILKKILDEAYNRDVKYLICEIGFDQKKSISEYCLKYDYQSLEFYQDLSGLDRGFILQI